MGWCIWSLFLEICSLVLEIPHVVVHLEFVCGDHSSRGAVGGFLLRSFSALNIQTSVTNRVFVGKWVNTHANRNG